MIKTFHRQFKNYKTEHLKFDFIAAIVVFLVAIPLCLGIALASSAPLFAGLLGGIIGGIVVGILSGSHVSVSGPAAGMAALVAVSIHQLGSFENFLLALTIAGLIQALIGFFRAGFIADFVPSNVVQGLLCAIGLLLIIKQLPLAFTLSNNLTELKTHLLETTEEFALAPVYGLYAHLNVGATLLTFISMGILVYFEKTRFRKLKSIPAPIIVVIVGILLNELFMLLNSPLIQNTPQLVQIPQYDEPLGVFKEMMFPNWQAWNNPQIYVNAVLISVVASLESLLNVKAAEKIDTKKRIASKNQELLAQGVGNFFAGLIGAIPVTSVIVRTSVNVQAGAKTKISTILHGFFILFAVILIPDLLNKIPLSSLAAILIYTGYKLTKPAIYKKMYAQGLYRFIPFIATVLSIVAFNLLEGILIGLAISFFYILKANSQARIDIIKENFPHAISNRLVLPQQISFLNKSSLVAELSGLPRNSRLTIDARYSSYIDQDILEFIQEFREGQAKLNKIHLNLIGFKAHYDIHNFIDFINVTSYNPQTALTPEAVLKILKEGNQRFLNDTRIHRSAKLDIQKTASEQRPIAIVLGCIDSRVPVETIFDMSFGDIFCIRIAGNVINEDIIASLEYGCHVIGAKLIVVLGHTQCGAIQAACDNVKEGKITQLLAKINPAIEAAKEAQHTDNGPVFVQQVTQYNVANTLFQIFNESPILKNHILEGTVGLSGAIYDVKSGMVNFDDYAPILAQLDANNSQRDLQQKIHHLFCSQSS